MTTLDRIEPAAEGGPPPRDTTQLPLAVVRWLLIGALTLTAWAGAATMAVSAAHEWTDLHPVWVWIAGVAATLPVAVGTFTAIDRLVEAPARPKTSGE
jgi:polyferredoxin